ncbi:MAG TPA: CPXCG motif-containing cysteine-rich protein [Gammaproteobacteria bacterium]|nr:CPXCG motif-containing cysteine-rich protein [Gammaproteobacteria bacterium]
MEEATVECPYCGEPFTALIDCSAGDQSYIEDCQICCRPIVFSVSATSNGELAGVKLFRDDD